MLLGNNVFLQYLSCSKYFAGKVSIGITLLEVEGEREQLAQSQLVIS